MTSGGWTAATLLLLACADPPEGPAAVAGTYVLRIPHTTDPLRLAADGRYVRVFVPSDEAAIVDTGAWRLAAGGRVVSLFGLPDRWQDRLAHGDSVPRPPGVPRPVGLAVRRGPTGTAWLEFRPELGWSYERVSRQPGPGAAPPPTPEAP